MRNTLILLLLSTTAGTALASDRADWSGPYVGAHLGYAWGEVDVTDTSGGVDPGPFSYEPSGVFGGGTAGVNSQIGAVVFGVEVEAGYMDLSGEGVIPSSNPIYHQDITLDGGFYGLIAGRLGVAWDDFMIYGKLGAAIYDGEAAQATTKPGYETQPTTETFSGAVYGGGVEHFIGENMSVKLEYLHFDFDTLGGSQTSITDPPIGFVYTNETDVEADTVKLGFTFHM